ncbi:MAG: hypothetical protein WC789_12200 [Lentisphaeria bacterium]
MGRRRCSPHCPPRKPRQRQKSSRPKRGRGWRGKDGRGTATDFQPALAIAPFASPFLGPVEPVFLEVDRLVRRSA